MSEPVIRTENLTKYYGKSRGAEDVNLTVREGEIFGFLGPNGAGKTTTIRLLLRLLMPTKGTVQIFGKDMRAQYHNVLQDIGYLPGELNLYSSMTGARMLSFFSAFHTEKSNNYEDELVNRLGCELHVPFRKLSSGNKRKIGILLALFHQPKLLILDEPTLGLDPMVQNAFYSLLSELKQDGTTIFLSSHNLSEVERICDRVGIIKEGRLVATEDIQTLKKRRKKKIQIHGTVNTAELIKIESVEIIETNSSYTSFYVEGGHIREVITFLAGEDIQDVDITYPDLENVFMAYYNS